MSTPIEQAYIHAERQYSDAVEREETLCAAIGQAVDKMNGFAMPSLDFCELLACWKDARADVARWERERVTTWDAVCDEQDDRARQEGRPVVGR